MPVVSEEYVENRKTMIAKAALEIFIEKGFYEVSMKDIMLAAKISRGGLYAHFENIDAVFIAVLIYDDSNEVNNLLNNISDTLFIDRLKSWVKNSILTNDNKDSKLVRAKSEFFLSHDINDFPYLAHRHKLLENSLTEFFKAGIGRGEFKKNIDISGFCQYLISTVDGINIHNSYKYNVDYDVRKIIEIVNLMIENYLM